MASKFNVERRQRLGSSIDHLSHEFVSVIQLIALALRQALLSKIAACRGGGHALGEL